MGITNPAGAALFKIFAESKLSYNSRKKRALQLGVQSSYLSKEFIHKLYDCFNSAKTSECNLSLIDSFLSTDIIPLNLFLEMWGYEIDSLDLSDYESAKIIANLDTASINKFPNLKSKYDLIIDGGTLEHCFNIKNAIDFLNELLITNGMIFHFSPSNRMIDHGFFQLSPTFFYDLYSQSNYSLVFGGLVKSPESFSMEFLKIYPYRFDLYRTFGKKYVLHLPQMDVIFCARKTLHSKIPISVKQSFYKYKHKNLIDSKNNILYEVNSSIVLKRRFVSKLAYLINFLNSWLLNFIKKLFLFPKN